MTEREIDVSDIITAVLNDDMLLTALNDNPDATILPDGTEAQLALADAIPHVVASTINALIDLGVLHFTPDPEIQPDEPK
jgi:hypothetical protein